LCSDRPIALDICCGLGGWSEGLVAAGWHVIGVDIEDMFAALNEPRPDHFELVIADICKVRGADYAHVSLIVGSSPCQDFSYRAMPWKRAKAMHAPFLGMWLFWQQFRIQQEVCEAKGEFVPMVVENVRGAIPWVGRSRANYGSYHVWGDVPALMPRPDDTSATKAPGLGAGWVHPSDPRQSKA
jgi:site-specific DNA-cytosine methylase